MLIFWSIDLERKLIWQKVLFITQLSSHLMQKLLKKILNVIYLHYLGPAVLRCFVTYSITIFNFGNTKSITNTGTKSFLKSHYCFYEPNNMLKVKYSEKSTKFEEISLQNCSWLLIIAKNNNCFLFLCMYPWMALVSIDLWPMPWKRSQIKIDNILKNRLMYFYSKYSSCV